MTTSDHLVLYQNIPAGVPESDGVVGESGVSSDGELAGEVAGVAAGEVVGPPAAACHMTKIQLIQKIKYRKGRDVEGLKQKEKKN